MSRAGTHAWGLMMWSSLAGSMAIVDHRLRGERAERVAATTAVSWSWLLCVRGLNGNFRAEALGASRLGFTRHVHLPYR